MTIYDRRLPVLLQLLFVAICLRLLSNNFEVNTQSAKSAGAAPGVLKCKPDKSDTFCPRLENNHKCHCPQSSWAMKTVEEMPTQSDVCRMIEGTSIFFAGDSIIRDTWIAGAMWLLILDDFNVLKKKPHRHSGMFCLCLGLPRASWDHCRASGSWISSGASARHNFYGM